MWWCELHTYRGTGEYVAAVGGEVREQGRREMCGLVICTWPAAGKQGFHETTDCMHVMTCGSGCNWLLYNG